MKRNYTVSLKKKTKPSVEIPWKTVNKKYTYELGIGNWELGIKNIIMNIKQMNTILLTSILLITNCIKNNVIETSESRNDSFVPEGYIQVWNDEFDDDNSRLPNADAWFYETGDHGWGNNELQNYIAAVSGTDSCAIVSGGTLKIIAKKKGDQVISIRMNTKKSWKYGYFEARLKLPRGKGTWPAFWMLPQNFRSWPSDGEIDIMEEVGYRPGWVSSSVHCYAYNHAAGTGKTGEQYIETAESDFHIYAVEWTDDYIRGFVDGKMHFEFRNDRNDNKNTWPFDVPFYLKLNLAWGGNWGGYEGIDESVLPAVYEIDYVRVYQTNR
ncbi:MAG: glycoside hydrolase family 16 protein [Tannerella sp.]|jgi:beta-glucanase (GH16 family)|nr:glycoside hydrolase family 16 protein [Tannerella sp.]